MIIFLLCFMNSWNKLRLLLYMEYFTLLSEMTALGIFYARGSVGHAILGVFRLNVFLYILKE